MRTVRSEIKEERMGKLPNLTVIIRGGKVLFYSADEVRTLAQISTEADNVPGWIYRAYALNRTNLHSRLHKAVEGFRAGADEDSIEGGIKDLLNYIADGNDAVLNVNSEDSYSAADLIWLRP